ncbi:MAG: hypothetical protein IPG50_36385 [Myxococcales bacterium]|nr:hypothetical protein [Myxococcales bacterium]
MRRHFGSLAGLVQHFAVPVPTGAAAFAELDLDTLRDVAGGLGNEFDSSGYPTDEGGSYGDFGGDFGSGELNGELNVGGDTMSQSGGDMGAPDGFRYDIATGDPYDADAAIEAMLPPAEYDETPIEIDATDVEPRELSAEEQFAIQVDLLQHHQDLASPALLNQGQIGDCFVVSTLNTIAHTPEGMAYLNSLVTPQGDGAYHVTLFGADGQPTTVLVAMDPNGPYGSGASGDPTLAILERAIGTMHGPFDSMGAYDSIANGGRPYEAMNDLGLFAQPLEASAALGYTPDGVDVLVVGTRPDAPGLADFGLVGSHAYSVVGSLSDPSTGEMMLILQNPWGGEHPSPIPASQVDSLFGYASHGMLPSGAGTGGTSGG